MPPPSPCPIPEPWPSPRPVPFPVPAPPPAPGPWLGGASLGTSFMTPSCVCGSAAIGATGAITGGSVLASSGGGGGSGLGGGGVTGGGRRRAGMGLLTFCGPCRCAFDGGLGMRRPPPPPPPPGPGMARYTMRMGWASGSITSVRSSAVVSPSALMTSSTDATSAWREVETSMGTVVARGSAGAGVRSCRASRELPVAYGTSPASTARTRRTASPWGMKRRPAARRRDRTPGPADAWTRDSGHTCGLRDFAGGVHVGERVRHHHYGRSTSRNGKKPAVHALTKRNATL